MTPKPWTEADKDAVAYQLRSSVDLHDSCENIASKILSLLNKRGMLIGSEKVQNRFSVEPITLSDLKQKYPELMVEFRKEIQDRKITMNELLENCGVNIASVFPGQCDEIRAEEQERCAKIAEDAPKEILQMWNRPGGPPGNGYRSTTFADISALIRALPPEKEEGLCLGNK